MADVSQVATASSGCIDDGGIRNVDELLGDYIVQQRRRKLSLHSPPENLKSHSFLID
jgi:hypothetical protein